MTSSRMRVVNGRQRTHLSETIYCALLVKTKLTDVFRTNEMLLKFTESRTNQSRHFKEVGS